MSRKDLGELMVKLFATFVAEFGDEKVAAVATAATINDLLADFAVGSDSMAAA
jgi:hypothetical protein